jgi:hypothetical protein
VCGSGYVSGVMSSNAVYSKTKWQCCSICVTTACVHEVYTRDSSKAGVVVSMRDCAVV